MEIKVLEYAKREYASSEVPKSHKGWARISVADKINIWFLVFISKSGNLWLKPPSLKIQEEFRAIITWNDESILSKISDEVIPKLKEMAEFKQM